jgi:hypothetical protein
MHRHLTLLFAVLFFSGCGKQPTPQAPVNGQPKEPLVELKVGDDQDEARHLPFKIMAVHEKQKPSKITPYHVNGGDWTFFDCQARGDPKVVFTVGVVSKTNAGTSTVAWGEAVLIVKDQDAGSHFVELFAKSFLGKLPAAVKRVHVPEPLRIKTAILGQNMHREAKGGFSGKKGGWMAIKWFLELYGFSGEVYFNFDLSNMEGEFSEKDPDYADDLLAILASALRDGPRPERTPENDPNLTRIAPKIGEPRILLPKLSSFYTFNPAGQTAVYEAGGTIFALPVEQPDAKPFEVIRFDNTPWTIHLLDDDLNFVVQEGIPENTAFRSSGDPMRIWWVDGKNKAKKLLRGPEKDLNLAEAPVSPDRRYIAFYQHRSKVDGKGRIRSLLMLDRVDDKVKEIELPVWDLSLVGWKTTDAGLRAVAVTNRWGFDKKKGSELYLADPSTGKLEHQKVLDARLEIDKLLLSPDKKHRVRVGTDDLAVTDTEGGNRKRFVFHADDRRFIGPECIEWVSPRYLKFNGPRLALIDVVTMKMCFPVSADKAKYASHWYKFNSAFRWVLYQGEGVGLFLAPVEMPKEQ